MTSRSTTAAFWLSKPGVGEIRSFELPSLRSGEARVRTLYSAVSRGTESLVFAGKIPSSEHERMRAPFQDGEFPGPVKYGYINVGIVEEGPETLCGKTVFCLYPHQSVYQVPTSALTVVPDTVPAERAVLTAGMETALNAIWDSELKIGDHVVVIGGGVIGALTAYLAGGVVGTTVTLVDIDESRRDLATSLGVRFQSTCNDLKDADLVFHASGTSAGLDSALGVAGTESRIIELSWYGDAPVSVALGGAFHARRLRIQSSQVGRLPASQQARWDYRRRLDCALSLLEDAVLDALISGECRFEELPAVLPTICAPGSGALCHRVRYPEPHNEES